MMDDPLLSLYRSVGGEQPFYDLAAAFYVGVEAEPLLRPLYPNDLVDAKRHLALFLIQRFGGPATYSAERGHPRLRMRHMPFRIREAEKEAWLRHMSAALDICPVFAPYRPEMQAYFDSTAAFLLNTDGACPVRA